MLYDWQEQPELNITPLVDIMLVLLAIMMVVAPTMVYEEKIMLPQGSKTEQITKLLPIHIVIDEHKNIKINSDSYEYNSFLDNFSLYSKKLELDAAVLISADKRLDYGSVMSVLGAVKQAGFKEVSLATNG